LIISVVTDSDRPGPNALRHPAQECIPCTPRGLLNRKPMLCCQSGHVNPLDSAGHAPILGQQLDELGIGISLCTAQAVVQMGDV
jgi:hypothetical protein